MRVDVAQYVPAGLYEIRRGGFSGPAKGHFLVALSVWTTSGCRLYGAWR